MENRFQRLAELAAAAARGEPRRLQAAAAACTARDGAAVRQEVLRLLHLFYGFPIALRALAAIGGRNAAGGRAGEADAGAGARLFDRLYGRDAATVRDRLQDLDPVLAAWVLDHAYGRVLNRPGLSLGEKERLAVLALADTGCWEQWKSHVRNARRLGVAAATLLADLGAVVWLDAPSRTRAREALAEG